MTVPGTESEMCEVVAISGVFQKADGKSFTDERAQLFIDGLLKWLRDKGFVYGGTYGFIHNDEEHEAFTHYKQHRADRAEARVGRLAVEALRDIGCLSARRCGDFPSLTACVRCAALSAIDKLNQGGQHG